MCSSPRARAASPGRRAVTASLAAGAFVLLALAPIACSSSSGSSSAPACTADDGGTQQNTGGDVVTYGWSCGSTRYKITCRCNELQSPPTPSCSCATNGTVTSTLSWTCGPLESSTIAGCGYPVP